MLRRLAPFLILVVSCSHGFADELQDLRRLWGQKDYQTVLPRLVDYWNAGGRTFEVEYMIGTSECRIPEFAAYGLTMLRDAMQSFNLNSEDRRSIPARVKAPVDSHSAFGVTKPPGHVERRTAGLGLSAQLDGE